MNTLFALYRNSDINGRAIILKWKMEHSDIAYVHAAILRRPSYERKEYWIAKVDYLEGKEISRTWGKYKCKTTKFVEDTSDQVNQITVIG